MPNYSPIISSLQWFGLEDEDINVNYEKRIAIYRHNPEHISNKDTNTSPNASKENQAPFPEETNQVASVVEANMDINKELSDKSIRDAVKTTRSGELVSNEDVNKTTFTQIANMRRRNPITTEEVNEYTDLIYSTINECVSVEKSVKYNLYAIVTNVKREPSPTRAAKLMSQVYVTDATCQGTYGFLDFQFRYDHIESIPGR